MQSAEFGILVLFQYNVEPRRTVRAALFIILLAFTLADACLSGAEDRSGPPSPSPEVSALQKQNAILEEKIKLLKQQQQVEKLTAPDPLSVQSEALAQRIRLMSQEQSLLTLSPRRTYLNQADAVLDRREDTIENTRLAYTALAGIAPEVAKALACEGKTIVLYGPSQADALVSVRTFNNQMELLRERLKSVMDIQAPANPEREADGSSVFGVSSLSGPVLQSVLDLISFFHSSPPSPPSVPVDESGMVALIANAATAQGCLVYWPDQYSTNPYNPGSQVLATLQTLADLNDNGGVAGKPAGLQQRLLVLRSELKRSESMCVAAAQKIEKEENKLVEGSKKVDALRTQIDFISAHIKDERNAALQEKLNRTFEKSWEELEVAVKRQLGSGLPGTIEEQGKLGEMSKRLDVLKTRTDWLSQYVKDEKDLAIQDKLKRALTGYWDQLDAAVKTQQVLMVSVPQAIEPDLREQRRWDKYSSDLKELIATTSAASEAYTTFRGALLDAGSGVSALTRMLRAESLRDLTFDEKFQERTGSSVVQLKLQRLTGSHVIKGSFNEKESFSGGVVLSFIQYEPNGKLKNSGVHTGYSGFKP